MAVAIIGPKFYAWDSDTGKPLAFGKVYTYQAGTNTPKATFTTEGGETQNANPVILNGAGYADIFLNGSYKVVVKDADDVEVWTSDPVSDPSQLQKEWVRQRNITQVNTTTFTVDGGLTDEYVKGVAIRVKQDFGFVFGTVVSATYADGKTTVELSMLDGATISSTAQYAERNIVAAFSSLGSDLVSHTGTSDTVTQALDKRTIYVGSVAELEAIASEPADGSRYEVTGYYAGTDVGGGPFYWDATSTETANGVTIFKATSITTGRFKRILSGKLTPEMAGAVGNGTADDTASLNSVLSLQLPVELIDSAIYSITGLSSVASIYLTCTGSSKIVLAALSNSHMISATDSIFIDGDITFDGNQSNQTDRLKSCINFTGTNIEVLGVTFINSVFSGVHCPNAPIDTAIIDSCKFYDMAEATGITGEQTQAVNFRISSTTANVRFTNCIVKNSSVLVADAAGGGFIFDVQDISLHSYSSIVVDGCYFERVGQRKPITGGFHYIGCVDLYNRSENTVITNNTAKDYYYTPFKITRSNRVICSNNIVDGDNNAGSSSAIAMTHSTIAEDVTDWVCENNVIRLSGENNSGIYIQGPADGATLSYRCTVSGNVVSGGLYGIRVGFMKSLFLSNNDIDECTGGILFENIPSASEIKYVINGGSIKGAGSRGLYLNGNSLNKATLIVNGVSFDLNTAYHIDGIYAKNAIISA